MFNIHHYISAPQILIITGIIIFHSDFRSYLTLSRYNTVDMGISSIQIAFGKVLLG